jgi:predicted GNAT family N-acyltransferase
MVQSNQMVVKELKFGSDGYHQLLAMRDRLLRTPLGLTWSKEDLDGEAEQLHFGLFDENQTLIACVVIKLLDEQIAKLRQMAVAEPNRAAGVGRCLVQGVEEKLRQRGVRVIQMDARKTAVGFYRKLGYKIEGEEFTQVTIPHFRMTREI